MAIGKAQPAEERVSEPQVTHLPEVEDSHPVILEPYHVDLLPEYGYVSREYLISGVAAGESYCTRLLLRCPADSNQFSGLVVEEPSHLWGGTSIWRHINRWLMRKGEILPHTTLSQTSYGEFEQAMLGWKLIRSLLRRLGKSRTSILNDMKICISFLVPLQTSLWRIYHS